MQKLLFIGKNFWLCLLLLSVLLFVSCNGLKSNSSSEIKSSFDSDYYRAFINDNGSMTFTDKDTGKILVDGSPIFKGNYGANSSIVVSPLNSSFENGENLPDDWQINGGNISLSTDYSSEGKKSLKFDANSNTNTFIFSSPINITPDKIFSISADSYYSEYYRGHCQLSFSWYTSENGTGPYKLDKENIWFPVTKGVWKTTTNYFVPPYSARSLRVFIINQQQDAKFYVDNIIVREISPTYQTNGEVSTSIVRSGEKYIVSSSYNGNQDVKIDNKYELNIHSPNIKYSAILTYKNNVVVSEERFDFVIPTQNGMVMTRDLAEVNFDTKLGYRSDQMTPRVVKFNNGVSFLGGDTMQSMYLRASENNSVISFYSDYELNHPLVQYVKNGRYETIDKSRQLRSNGDSHTATIIFTINTSKVPKSLVKMRQPFGCDATLLFVTHADGTVLKELQAVAYGSEDNTNSGNKGIIGHGIGWTFSVWVSGGDTYMDLSKAPFKSLIDRMHADGVEIAPHTITDGTDNRSVVKDGLNFLSQYNSRNWIDHGGQSGTINWEDVSSQGAIVGDPNYILDLLKNAGYNYAWAEPTDANQRDYISNGYNDLNMMISSNVQAVTPIFFQNNNAGNLYLWGDWEGEDQPDLYFTKEKVDRLIAQRGVNIYHNYIAKDSTQPNHAFWINNGIYEIYPPFDAELAYIQSIIQAGIIWSPTVSTACDYWKSLQNVKVILDDEDNYIVINNNTNSISGLTLLASSTIQTVTVNGKTLPSFGGIIKDNKIILPTLYSGQSVVIKVKYNE